MCENTCLNALIENNDFLKWIGVEFNENSNIHALETSDDLNAFNFEPAPSFLYGMLAFTFRRIELVFGDSALPLPIRIIPPPCV